MKDPKPRNHLEQIMKKTKEKQDLLFVFLKLIFEETRILNIPGRKNADGKVREFKI